MIAALLLGSLFAASPEAYIWPLDLPQVITSSFGEYRPGRLHMGLDLRTGRTGVPVKAPSAGDVVRVRCSPYGYGKAVYLRLDDGHLIVFGHLDSFMPELATYVRAEQHAREQYTVDLTPPLGRFRVHAGEVLAYSGDTGIGPAHLHYEIRDKDECALNPRLLGVTWPDVTAPVVRRVVVYPATPESRVENGCLPVVREVTASGDGHYVCDPVHVTGRVTFAIDAIDPANNGDNILGVHTATLSEKKTILFEVRNDRISYANLDNGVVCYDPVARGKGPLLLLWRWPANRSETVSVNKTDGTVAAPEKKRGEVHIVLEDFAHKRAEVTVPLLPEVAAPNVEPSGTTAQRTGTVSTVYASGRLVTRVMFDTAEADAPRLVVNTLPEAQGEPIVFRRVTDRVFDAVYAPPAGVRSASLRVAHPYVKANEQHFAIYHRGENAPVADLGGLRIEVPADAPFDTLFFRQDTPADLPPAPARMLGEAYRLWNGDAPIDAAIRLSFPIPTDAVKPERAHLYRATQNGWTGLDTERGAGRLSLTTRTAGAFATMEDTDPPEVELVQTAAGSPTPWPRPAIEVHVRDAASGIAEIRGACNGRWLLMDYDPEKSLVTWARDEDLPDPPVTLDLTVIDRAGNTATLHAPLAP